MTADHISHKQGIFTCIAQKIATWAGHPATFICAATAVIVWAACGPLFGYSDTWQLVINTSTTIITFLMVFLIQNTQNRDTHALQMKLDELIRTQKGANIELLDLEELEEHELDKLHRKYEKMAEDARTKRRKEEGSVIFYILIAVALFAALGYAFTSSMNDTSPEQGNEQEGMVYAQELISYSQRIDRGVQRVLDQGCSENDLSFYDSAVTELAGYIHTPDGDSQCKVFHANGGAVSWQEPANRVNDGSEWVMTGQNRVSGVGSNTAGTGNELVIILPKVGKQACMQANKLLNIITANKEPPVEIDNVSLTPYTGTFASNNDIQSSGGELNGQRTGCFEATQIDGAGATNTYYFYHVLIAR